MLYRYSKEMQPDVGGRNVLHPLEYYSCADISDKEKDLEELLVTYMSELYTADGLLMPIFQIIRKNPTLWLWINMGIWFCSN